MLSNIPERPTRSRRSRSRSTSNSSTSSVESRGRRKRRISSSEERSRPSSVSSEGSLQSERDSAWHKDDEPPAYRIPKKSHYEDALGSVPIPPKRSRVEKRERVALPEETKAQLEEWMKGLYMSSSDRLEFLKTLPLPASTLALPPSLDEDLRTILGSRSLFKYTTRVAEKDLLSLHELSANAINLLALVKKLAVDNSAELPPTMAPYLDLIGDLLSISMRDITGLRRELALSALGLQRRDMPSIRTLPLDGSSHLDVKTDEYSPNLFGTALKEEVLAADSAVKKSIDKLKKSRSSDRQSSYKRAAERRNFPSRRTRPYDNSNYNNKNGPSTSTGFRGDSKKFRGGAKSSFKRSK